MSIDYDRLRELLHECTTGQWQSHDYEPDPYCYPGATKFVLAADWDRVEIAEGQAGPSTKSPEYARKASDFELMALAPDMARELLRLRRQNDQLTAENERLRDGVEQQITHLEALLEAAKVTEHYGFAGPIQARVTELTSLLNGDTE